MLASAVVRTVAFCTRHPWPVIIVALALAVMSAIYAAAHFAINTDAAALLPRNLPWRQSEAALKATFPQRQLLVLVDGPTPELTDIATARLTHELEGRDGRFRALRQLRGGEFFERSALLYLPVDQVTRTVQRFREAGPIVAMLRADPSLRGVMQALAFGARSAQEGRLPQTALTLPMAMLSNALDDLFAGRRAIFSWRELISGETPLPEELRGFIEVEPVLDFSALQPGRAAEDAIREAADQLKLGPELGASIHLTGQLAIKDEQFVSLSKGAFLNLAGAVLAVLVIIWLALRSARIILGVFFSLIVGLVITAAAGLMMVGAFNLISVAFAVLLIGLGADFGIQFSVRYRSERHDLDDLPTALRSAAAKAGGPLALVAASTAVGFFCFLPTVYRGVSELGQIAGAGMIIAFVATVTLFPALLSIFNPPREPYRMGFSALASADRFLARHRIAVVAGTILVALAGAPLLSQMHFDFDPMHLQDPNGDAIKSYRELSNVPEAAINSAEIIAASAAEARRIARQLAALPEVAGTRTLDTLLPADQDKKLSLIQSAATALGATPDGAATHLAPTDAENVEAIRAAVSAIKALDAGSGDRGSVARLESLLTHLADADPALRAKAQDALVMPLKIELDRVRKMLKPVRVTAQTLPRELADDWLAADGRARVQVLPKGDPNDTVTLTHFADAIVKAAPEAAGMPISMVHSEHTVIWAFIEAGIYAVLAIAVILWIALRRVGDVLLTLVPLIVAGAVTLELTVLIGEPLNFANVIALPLLLGVGVAFKIYYIMAWRRGATNLLQSTLTRAVLFSALTTATAFGSLWLSNQPGLSSMGKLMALALVCTMAAAVLFQPALMGPPRVRENAREREAPPSPSSDRARKSGL